MFAVQPMRRAVFASLRCGGFGTVPRVRRFFFLNAPVTVLRSGALCDQFTDQLLRDLIAKETIEGLGIFCYLASLFSSGSVAVSELR